MDFFSSAALLVGVVLGLTQVLKKLIPVTAPPWVTEILAIAVGIAATFTIAHSTIGHTQSVFGITLDLMSAPLLVIVGVFAGGLASVVVVPLITKAIPSIGQNQPPNDTPATPPADPVL